MLQHNQLQACRGDGKIYPQIIYCKTRLVKSEIHVIKTQSFLYPFLYSFRREQVSKQH